MRPAENLLYVINNNKKYLMANVRIKTSSVADGEKKRIIDTQTLAKFRNFVYAHPLFPVIFFVVHGRFILKKKKLNKTILFPSFSSNRVNYFYIATAI